MAGITNDRYRVRCVPSDDIYNATLIMSEEINSLSELFSETHLIADYTGGTKTMSAALVIATLEASDIELQLVTGLRPDLSNVKQGTEQSYVSSIQDLRIRREINFHLSAWSHFAYREADNGLDTIRPRINSPEQASLKIAKTLSIGFASWDDFNHISAMEHMKTYDRLVNKTWDWIFPTLKILTGPESPKKEPLRLYDLWWNAERRANQGRYDDAVARTYRLIEWVAQWQLKSKCGIDTADVCSDELLPDMREKQSKNSKTQIGLRDAWRLTLHKVDGLKDRLPELEHALDDFLSMRNYSILAHGFKPVQREEWRKMKGFMDKVFLPVLTILTKEAGLKTPSQQLPKKFPENLSF